MARRTSIGKKHTPWPGRRAQRRASRGAGPLNGQAGEAGLPCLQVITSHSGDSGQAQEPSAEPFRLSGSARRSAYALETNALAFVKATGIDRVLFMTLTFGGGKQGPTVNAAQAKFHRFQKHALSRHYPGGLKVLERGGEKGRIHFHLLIDAGADVRSGANFEAIDAGEISSLNPACRAEYSWLRESAPKYGFGKVVNSLPIKSTEEGVARYVSKYISKHMAQRLNEDKGARLCSYWGTARKHRECCSLKFSWAGIGGWLFRAKLAGFSKLNGIKDQDGWADRFGPRWAYQIQKFVKVFPLAYWPTGMHAIHDGIELLPGVDASTVIDLRMNRETEIRGSTLHGKSIYWLALAVPEPGWIERGRIEQAAKRALAPTAEKVEWVDVTEIHGDVVVSRKRQRFSCKPRCN